MPTPRSTNTFKLSALYSGTNLETLKACSRAMSISIDISPRERRGRLSVGATTLFTLDSAFGVVFRRHKIESVENAMREAGVADGELLEIRTHDGTPIVAWPLGGAVPAEFLADALLGKVWN